MQTIRTIDILLTLKYNIWILSLINSMIDLWITDPDGQKYEWLVKYGNNG